MGIDTHSLNLLRYARQKYGDLGDTITLGRLAVLLGPKAMQKWTGAKVGSYGEEPLIKHFGATHVDSIDNSPYEGASIVADMNKPAPESLTNRYDTVLDFGCTEHIFDIAQCYRNIARMCKPGGRLLHVVPSNGFCGHGFYQFSPEFYFSRYSEANGYMDTEVYLASPQDVQHWYRVPAPHGGKRINVRSADELYVLAISRYKGGGTAAERTQQSDYEFTWAQTPVNIAAEPHSPGRFARIKELLSQNAQLAKWAYRIDTMLSENGPRTPRQHPALTRIPVDSLLKSV